MVQIYLSIKEVVIYWTICSKYSLLLPVGGLLLPPSVRPDLATWWMWAKELWREVITPLLQSQHEVPPTPTSITLSLSHFSFSLGPRLKAGCKKELVWVLSRVPGTGLLKPLGFPGWQECLYYAKDVTWAAPKELQSGAWVPKISTTWLESLDQPDLWGVDGAWRLSWIMWLSWSVHTGWKEFSGMVRWRERKVYWDERCWGHSQDDFLTIRERGPWASGHLLL